MPDSCELRQCKYLINIVEQDHRFIKRLVKLGMGFFSSETAWRTDAVCERFLGSVRRECLDHYFILYEKQLTRLLKANVVYFNHSRPHQGLGQRIPDPLVLSASPPNLPNKVFAVPVLGGLHHDYQRAA